MTILSQNKRHAVNYDRIENINITKTKYDKETESIPLYEKWKLIAYFNTRHFVLGEYGTEERTVQLLNEIVKKYSEIEAKKLLAMGNAYVNDKDFGFKRETIKLNDFIFILPEK